jgi:hypothetical protein
MGEEEKVYFLIFLISATVSWIIKNTQLQIKSLCLFKPLFFPSFSVTFILFFSVFYQKKYQETYLDFDKVEGLKCCILALGPSSL